ncbi:MAG: MFS transporter [Bryobacteraceae bacterium]|nr:MFS transporter [Bryobacteraceae bacterium]
MPKTNKWVLVATLFLASALNYADRTSITSVYALLKSDLGFSDAALGAMGSLFLWSYALASPVGGYLGDRFARGPLILASLASWSLITLVTGLAVLPWHLLALRVALGIVEAAYLPAAFALVAAYHGPSTRGAALGIIALGNAAGLVGGGTLAGYLGEHYGWRAPLITLGAAGLLLAVVCRFLLPMDPAEPATAEKLSYRQAATELLRVPSIAVLAVAGLLTSIGGWIFINWLPLYFHENFGLSLARAGFLGSSLVGLSGAATLAVGGWVSDRVAMGGAHRRMWMQAALILCAAPVLLTFLATRQQTAIMIALVAYSVLRTSADVNILPLLCDLTNSSQRSTIFGLTNMVNTMAGGAGVLAAGLLKSSAGLNGVFAGVAGILLLDAALLFACCILYLHRDLVRHA